MLTNSEIKFIKSLYLKKSRDLNSLFIVEGDKMINELLSSDFTIENVYATKGWYDDNFSKKLGSLGDIYINDAFSCSHRKQASIHKITKYIDKSYGGPLLKKEIDAITISCDACDINSV